MKKAMLIFMAMTMLFLAGCGGAAPAETTVPETQAPVETTLAPETEPTETEPPVPETISGTVQADKTAVVLTVANRGDVLDIAGEFDETHYVVKLENGYGLIEKRLVRLEGEEAYAGWEGYAKYNSVLYPTYALKASEGEVLTINTKVQVLEKLGDVLMVQLEDRIGYMEEAMVSTYYIRPSGGSADGGDISLGFTGGISKLSVFVPQSGEATGKATVLTDGAEILLGWFDRGEEVSIVNEAGFAEEKEGFCTIYLDGLYGYIRQNFLMKEGEEAYAEWKGYAKYGAVLYTGSNLTGEGTKLNTNAEVQVLADLGDCYLAVSGDVTGFISKDNVSQTPIAYGGGGGGGEWTPPAM